MIVLFDEKVERKEKRAMTFKSYKKLPDEARQIREEVFVEEQKFQKEFDSLDEICTHIVAYLDGEPIGTCRYYPDEEKGRYVIGRLAVRRNYRGQDIGGQLLREVEEQVRLQGGKRLSLHAQVRAKSFYEKQGYHAEGEIEMEEYCPHIWMHKILGT